MRALLGARASEKFLEGFAKSASMIVLSEIGDKTFFIAALLAVRHARAVVQKALAAPCGRVKIKTKSFMQRGADLEYLSAFPAEKELLYPPLTFLQPTGWSMEHSVGGVKFTVIEVEPFAG